MVISVLITLNNLNISLLDKGLGLYAGLFFASATTQSFQIFIFIICGAILQLTGFYSRKVWHLNCSSLSSLFFQKINYHNTNVIGKMTQQFKIIEYPLILLFIITGGVFLVSCGDIVSIFLSIELQSYGLYLLSTIYRDSELSTSAGLTYFLLGGLSSCFILLGTSLLYANYGTTNIDGFHIINNISNTTIDDIYSLSYKDKPFYINISLLVMSVGFLFKISAAPFHFWSPDVYDAIPTIVTTFVAIIPKISILVFLLGFAYYTYNSGVYNFDWKEGLLFSSLLSFIVGTVLGLTQSRIKRLFAYSTISHIGFLLLAISIGSLESTKAFIFYIIQYTISNFNAFIILVLIGSSLYSFTYDGPLKNEYKNLQDKNNSPIQLISQLKGYYHINPALALSLVITLFSFIGIPPLIGFFAKQMVLSAALDSGYFFLTFVAIITSVISAAYYLSVIKQIFFDKVDYKLDYDIAKEILFANVISVVTFSKKKKHRRNIEFNINNIKLSSFFSITISILTLILLLFMYDSTNLLNVASILGLITIST